MLYKKIKLILIFLLLYQTPIHSKSISFNEFDSKNLSKYFSGIIAFDNKSNLKALNFFNSSKILLNKHDPYLKRYTYSLILDDKIPHAINLIKKNKEKKNSNFFDAKLILILDSLKRNDFSKAYLYLVEADKIVKKSRFDEAILESLKQYIYVFKEKKIPSDNKNFGQLSNISEAFQRCYLGDMKTDIYFSNLINDKESDYTRYIFFYLSYLIENNRLDEAKNITNEIHYINTTLLLSQAKNWIENKNSKKITNVFSCKNHNDVISEFLFLISNLYSSQDNFVKSNFYLNLSNFLNDKFIFNLSLVVENQYYNGEFKKAKKTLKNFQNKDSFYYWYRIKKEALIIYKQRNKEESLNYITAEYNKINIRNEKILFDIANFYKNFEKYPKAIEYYTKIINALNDKTAIKADLLYRRGGCYERLGNYKEADKDMLQSLEIKPNEAQVLNYLAYSWLERNYNIDDSIDMLKKAYELKNNDPYIIDSIGWAYYLIDDYSKAEEFLKRAVELMPEDPIVNDHYGDILWKLDRKIQARYFWKNVLKMDDAEDEMIEKINIKIIEGPSTY